MKTIKLTLSSPDGTVFDSDVVSASVRGADGDLAVLAGHVPFVTTVKAGKCVVLTEDDEITFSIGAGLLTVSSDKAVILAESVRQEAPDK